MANLSSMMILGGMHMTSAVNLGSDVMNSLSQPVYKENRLAQVMSDKVKRAEQGDVDIVWLIIVILAIIVLALIIWLVIWYNCCREDEENKEEKEEKKEDMMMDDKMMMGMMEAPADGGAM